MEGAKGREGSMGDVVPMSDRPLSEKHAIQRIRVLWAEGEVVPLYHAEARMRKRSIDILDVAHVITRTGRVVEVSKPGQLWRYTLEGKSVEGRKLCVIVEMNGRLLIVTVFYTTRR